MLVKIRSDPDLGSILGHIRFFRDGSGSVSSTPGSATLLLIHIMGSLVAPMSKFILAMSMSGYPARKLPFVWHHLLYVSALMIRKKSTFQICWCPSEKSLSEWGSRLKF